jgi:hypothetical protein
MMGERSVTEEARQHGKRAGCQHLIDERLLPFQRLDRRAAWQRIFSRRCVYNLRIEFTDRPQAFCLSAIAPVQRLTENKLAACRVVADIEPLSQRFSVYV